ncbi:MAG: hypothetical protein ACRESS_04385 [Stenotrophobium sp.]
MTLLRSFLLASSLLIAGVALAHDPVVVVHEPASQQPGSNSLNIQKNHGSHCEAMNVGSCGSCAVSCAVGEAAMCRPGKAVGRGEDASCVRDPVCQCKQQAPVQ